MTRAATSGRASRASREAPSQFIALAGKGVPGSGDLEEAIEAVARAGRALHALTRRRAHEWKPGHPEVQLRRPGGVRGGFGWTVRLAVPAFVTARDVHEAVAEAAALHEVAKNIRLGHVEEVAPEAAAQSGRDRQPAGIRRTRAGAPQHRARDLR
jgi:hypothetical protein